MLVAICVNYMITNFNKYLQLENWMALNTNKKSRVLMP